MAIELTKEESDRLNDLNENMDSKLAEFEAQNQNKSKEALLEDATKLESYLQSCYNSEVDDTEINIRYNANKLLILKGLIRDVDGHCPR